MIPIHIVHQAGKTEIGAFGQKLDLTAAAKNVHFGTAGRIIVAGLLALIGAGAIIATMWGGTGLLLREPEPSAHPGVNQPWLGANATQLALQLESDDNEIYRERQHIASLLAQQPGDRIAVVGAGSGFFAEELARRTGSGGVVTAVEINPELVQMISTRASRLGLSNLRAHEGLETKLNINRRDGGNFDLIVLPDSYHHLEYPKSMLHSFDRLLRRRGQLVVIERQIGPDAPPHLAEHVRLNQQQVIAEITAQGFELVAQPTAPFLKDFYILRFRKD